MDEYCFKQAPWARLKTNVYVDEQREVTLRIKVATRDPIPYRNETQKVMFAVGVEGEVNKHLRSSAIEPAKVKVAVGDHIIDIFITLPHLEDISLNIKTMKGYLDTMVANKKLAKLIKEAWAKSLHVLSLQLEDDDVMLSLD